MIRQQRISFVLAAAIAMALSSSAFASANYRNFNWTGQSLHSFVWQWAFTYGDSTAEYVDASGNGLGKPGSTTGTYSDDWVWHVASTGAGNSWIWTDHLNAGATSFQYDFMHQHNRAAWYRFDFEDKLNANGNRPRFRTYLNGPSNVYTLHPSLWEPPISFGNPGLWPGGADVYGNPSSTVGDPNYGGAADGSRDNPSDNIYGPGGSFFTMHAYTPQSVSAFGWGNPHYGVHTTTGQGVVNNVTAPFGGLEDPNSGNWVQRNVDDFHGAGEYTSYIIGLLPDNTLEFTVITREAGPGGVSIDTQTTMQQSLMTSLNTGQAGGYDLGTSTFWGLYNIELNLTHTGNTGVETDFFFLHFQVGNEYKSMFNPGDIDRDGTVDMGDLALIGAQWDTPGTLGLSADIAGVPNFVTLYAGGLNGNTNRVPYIGDGTVDIGDLAIAGANWNDVNQYSTVGGGEGDLSAGTTVPAPGAGMAGLALLGVMGTIRCRRAA
ncbi:MAG: hypothetical protein CMJ49_04845 [Planctomycetaceae bacterium]|nr:hypothetical protein [Planctomycetaceae bacterium]